MSSFDTEKFIAFIGQKWGGRSCPMCGNGPWTVQDKVFQLSEYHGGDLVVGGPLVPLVPVTCTNCGYTVVVNAILSGAIAAPTSASEKKE
jgi:hypothetical protein